MIENTEFLKSAIERCDEHLRLHKGLRHQTIAVLLALAAIGLTVASATSDHVLRIVGCAGMIAVAAIVWVVGEKELTMVMYYTHLGQRLGRELSPDAQQLLLRCEEDVRGAMQGDTRIAEIAPLRGALRVVDRMPFREIWRVFAVVVVLLALFIILRPVVV